MVNQTRHGKPSGLPKALDSAARERRASQDRFTGVQRFDTWHGWQDVFVRAFTTTTLDHATGKRVSVKRYRLVVDGWHGARRYRDPNYAANDARLSALACPSLWRYAPVYRALKLLAGDPLPEAEGSNNG